MDKQPAALLKRFLGSILTAAVVGFTVFMALVLTLADGEQAQEIVLAVETRVSETLIELNPVREPAETATTEPTITPVPTAANQMVADPTAAIRPTACVPPAGWAPITVQQRDTLLRLSLIYNVGESQLINGNCLDSTALLTGSTVYVPAAPIPTNTPIPTDEVVSCGPPVGWIQYQVRPNDNLFRISLDLEIGISEILFANCRESNDVTLTTNELIFLPELPVNSGPPGSNTSTPTAIPTVPNTPEPPTATNTPVPPPATSTAIPPTPTPPPPPTATSTIPVPTNTPTNTPLPPTSTPTATNTVPAPTNTPTNTPVPPTSTPTNTPEPPTPTNTPEPPTPTPSPTP